MNENPRKDPLDRMVDAYENMLERVDGWLKGAENAIPSLRQGIDHAREKAVEMDELTREEAQKIGTYLERDVHDAAQFLVESGTGFRNWLRFETELIENRLLEMFAGVADKTRLELETLAERARAASNYHTGEVTGPGTIRCMGCGKEIHFHKTGHIPPCPKCHGTSFHRNDDDSADAGEAE